MTLDGAADASPNERSSLLPQFRPNEPMTQTRPGSKRMDLLRSVSNLGDMFSGMDGPNDEQDPTTAFTGLNGLEIAAVADCKKFLSQKIVQKIITSIWRGDIVFWESLSPSSKKKPQFYNKRLSDPFTRLRVPRYIKAFEVAFFATFLVLYYAVLVERNPFVLVLFRLQMPSLTVCRYRITPIEVALYVWFAAFAYDELGEFIDAGSIFYAVDIWNGCDLIIILIGAAFLITSKPGFLSLKYLLYLQISQGSLVLSRATTLRRRTALPTRHSISCHWKLCLWFRGKLRKTYKKGKLTLIKNLFPLEFTPLLRHLGESCCNCLRVNADECRYLA
jgi:hypothetical protein